MLSLKQQMWLEPDFPLEIERPELDLNTLDDLENETFETVYNLALTTQPQIKASEIRKEASDAGIDIARSQMMPTLSLGGEIGTNWSDLDREVIGYNTILIPQTVYIEGQPVNVEFESEIPSAYRGVPYFRQLDNNIGYGLGASLSIPIFNNYAAKANVEKSKNQCYQFRH